MSKIVYCIGSFVFGVLIGNGVTNHNMEYTGRVAPDVNVQEGYIPPRDIRFDVTDHDGDGLPETIMRISDEQYCLRTGEPVFSKCEIRPAEMVTRF